MKRIATIASIILAVLVGGALLTAYARVGNPANLAELASGSSQAASSVPQPAAGASSTAPKPDLKITSGDASADDAGEAGEVEAGPQPAPIPFEGGTNPAGGATALEGAWQYYENPDAAKNGETVMTYQYRFYNESSTLNLNYGEFSATIGVNMLGTYAIAADGTITLTDITWSSKDDLLGFTGGSAVFTAAWPADGQPGIVMTLHSYETGNGESIPAFDHILGAPLLCAPFGETTVDNG